MNGDTGRITTGNNYNGNRRQWIWRIVIILLIIAAAPAVIGAVAMIVSHLAQAIGHFFANSISSFSQSLMAGDRIEVITRLCLWLIIIIIIAKVLVRK